MLTGRVNAYREAAVSLVVRGPANVTRQIDAVVGYHLSIQVAAGGAVVIS